MQKSSELMMSLALLQTRLLKRVDNRLSLHGISFSEFMVMHHLSDAPKKSMRRIDLAEMVGLSASGITRLLNPMEKIGLVEKALNPRDARVRLVRLSDAGEQRLNDARITFEQSADQSFLSLDSEQSDRLSETIKVLLN